MDPLPPLVDAVRQAQRAWLEAAAPTIRPALDGLPERLPQFGGFVLYVSWIRSAGAPQVFGVPSIGADPMESDFRGYLCALGPEVQALSDAYDTAWTAAEDAQAEFDTRALERALVHDLQHAWRWTQSTPAVLEVGSSPDWRIDLTNGRVLLAP